MRVAASGSLELNTMPLSFDTGSPTKADASRLRLALRVLLGDRPLQAAARLNRQSAAARSSRARRELMRRRGPERAQN